MAARESRVASVCAQIVAFVHKLRASDLFKLPGVAETLEYQDDLARITGPTARAMVDAARSTG